MPKVPLNIARLREAVDQLHAIDALLDELNSDPEARRYGWNWLMGFDLPWLADKFDEQANRMEYLQ